MGIHARALVLPDVVTIAYPAENPVLDGRARRSRGIVSNDETVEVRGQLEPNNERRRDDGALGAKDSTSQVLILDAKDCELRGYTPTAQGHKLKSIRWRSGITTPYNIYFSEVTFDAAGYVYRISLSDRDPARRSA